MAMNKMDELEQGTTRKFRTHLAGMRVGKEVGRLLFDLLQLEALARISTVGGDVCAERALHATLAFADLGAGDVVAHVLRIGERKTWRSGLTGVGLVDVGRGKGGGLVFTGDTDGADVPTDDVLVAVDAEAKVAKGARLTGYGLTVAADDRSVDWIEVQSRRISIGSPTFMMELTGTSGECRGEIMRFFDTRTARQFVVIVFVEELFQQARLQ